METLFFKTPADFRKWFLKNHDKIQELWVGYYKKSSGEKSISWEESVDEALCFGWIDGIRKSIDEKSYKIRFTPRKPSSIWSKINKQKTDQLIKEGKMTDSGLSVIEIAKRTGKWDSAYRLKEGTELPEDFKKALSKNKKASAYFNGLSNSNKHSYINHVNAVKSKEKRPERVKQVVELLEKGIKPYINGRRALSVYFGK